MSDRTKNHETIHYHQQREMLFIFQWLLYLTFYIWGMIRYKDGETAYRENPFEREAYANDDDLEYITSRKQYSWVKYIWNKA